MFEFYKDARFIWSPLFKLSNFKVNKNCAGEIYPINYEETESRISDIPIGNYLHILKATNYLSQTFYNEYIISMIKEPCFYK